MSHHWYRLYTYADYLTPGAAETVELMAQAVRPEHGATIVDIASGKGTAAVTLANLYGHRVLGFDRYIPFLEHATQRAEEIDAAPHAGHFGGASFTRADGRCLPLADASVDGGYCIGGPSIVGTEECFREFARVVRPGGAVVVSDLVWRLLPAEPLGEEWGWVRDFEQVTADLYEKQMAAAGLAVEQRHVHDRATWDDYHEPMARIAAEARVEGDTAFADETEASIALENRAADLYWDYVTFVARRE